MILFLLLLKNINFVGVTFSSEKLFKKKIPKMLQDIFICFRASTFHNVFGFSEECENVRNSKRAIHFKG